MDWPWALKASMRRCMSSGYLYLPGYINLPGATSHSLQASWQRKTCKPGAPNVPRPTAVPASDFIPSKDKVSLCPFPVLPTRLSWTEQPLPIEGGQSRTLGEGPVCCWTTKLPRCGVARSRKCLGFHTISQKRSRRRVLQEPFPIYILSRILSDAPTPICTSLNCFSKSKKKRSNPISAYSPVNDYYLFRGRTFRK